MTLAQARALVKRRGVLLLVPDFVEAVVGGKVKGSWWGHAKGGEIFRLGEALEDDPDVLVMKLVGGKTTFVHRKLWADLLAVVLDEEWRAPVERRLSSSARALLARVEGEGSVLKPAALPAKELEASMLVHSISEHTASGAHQRRLTSWPAWAMQRRVKAATGGWEKASKRLRSAPGHPQGAQRIRP